MAIDSMDVPWVAYNDYGLGARTAVRRWNGSEWEAVGPPTISPLSPGPPSLTFDQNNRPVVAYRNNANNGQVSVQIWDGSQWSELGDGSSSPGSSRIKCSPSGVLTSALSDGLLNGRLSVKQWNNNTWEYLGPPGISTALATQISLAFDEIGYPWVAYSDYALTQKLTVQRWNGSMWILVGEAGISDGPVWDVSLIISGAAFVAYRDNTNGNRTTVQQWNGSSWNVLGYSGFSDGFAFYQNIETDTDGHPIVAYTDYDDFGAPIVKKWNGSSWNTVGETSLPMRSTGTLGHWLKIDSQGKMIMAFANGGLYARTFTPVQNEFSSSNGSLTIGPNPNNDGEVWISLHGLSNNIDHVLLQLYDTAGRKLSERAFPVSNGVLHNALELPANLANGMYIIQLTDGDNRWSGKFIQAKE